MTFETAKKSYPSLNIIAFNEYVLMLDQNRIIYAFLREYIYKGDRVGSHHLGAKWVAEIQKQYDKKNYAMLTLEKLKSYDKAKSTAKS
jgi:hypothetical protein